MNQQLKFQAVIKALIAGYHTVTLFMDLWPALIMRNLWCKLKYSHQFKSKSFPKLFPNKNSAYEALTWKSVQTYHQGISSKSPVRWRTALELLAAKVLLIISRVGQMEVAWQLHLTLWGLLLVIRRWIALKKVKRTQGAQVISMVQLRQKYKRSTRLRWLCPKSSWFLIMPKHSHTTVRT